LDIQRKPIALSAIFSTINAWRHPDLDPSELIHFEFYRNLVDIAERGKLDMVFFGDMLGVNGVRGRIVEDSIVSRNEPLTLLAALAASSESIGFVGTLSTTYTEPYQVARKFATLDRLSQGRIAWNVVTSLSTVEDTNFANEPKLDQALRYERTGAFIDIVNRLWTHSDSREDQIADGATLTTSPSTQWFKEPQQLNVTLHSPHPPVIIQAGTSEAFREQAARTADAIFTAFTTLEQGQAFYKSVKSKMALYNRQPDELKIMPGLCVIVAETEDEAKAKERELAKLVPPSAAISVLSARLGRDLSGIDIHTLVSELPDHTLDNSIPGDSLSMKDQILRLAIEKQLTLLELGQLLSTSRGHNTVVGTPAQVADYMERWVDSQACDGFNLMLPYLPGGLEDITRYLVPELQRRGRFRTEYEERTLRGHLGLAK